MFSPGVIMWFYKDSIAKGYLGGSRGKQNREGFVNISQPEMVNHRAVPRRDDG